MKTLTKTNSPFATEQAAKIQASRLGLEVGKYLIVPFEDGYAIETPEPIAVDSAEQGESEVTTEITTDETTTVAGGTSTVTAPAPIKHRVTTPWKPSSYLEIPEKYRVAGRRYRWCKKDKPGNIDKKRAEGWEIDKELTKKMQRLSVSLEDGKGLDGTLQVREMVVMWMPEEVAREREKYYADKAGAAQKSAQAKYRKEARDLSSDGGGAYGDVQITRG